MGYGLPRRPAVPGAPVVPEDLGGPGDPGDLAVLGCRTSLSPLRIRAGLSLQGTLGHLSLPVGEIQSLAHLLALFSTGAHPGHLLTPSLRAT